MSTSSSIKNKPKRKSQVISDEDEDSEHELIYYANDRVKLMKEVLKLLKPKKIKAMAPDCLKPLDVEELNSMLLEELLGISTKRLKKIFEGQNNDDESSSESEEDIDIISLDDITDDDDIGIIDLDKDSTKVSTRKRKHKRHSPRKVKKEPQEVEIKKEKDTPKETLKNKKKEGDNSDQLLSVLELLELQARARAIKSQLIIEAENKAKLAEKSPEITIKNESDSDDAVIIEIPKNDEIIIPSDSEEENTTAIIISQEILVEKPPEISVSDKNVEIIDLDEDEVVKETEKPKKKSQKVKIIRNRLITPANNLKDIQITFCTNKSNVAPKNNDETNKVKEELANVSEFIGPTLGPIEMIHLDTLNVDLNEITLPNVTENNCSSEKTQDNSENVDKNLITTKKVDLNNDIQKIVVLEDIVLNNLETEEIVALDNEANIQSEKNDCTDNRNISDENIHDCLELSTNKANSSCESGEISDISVEVTENNDNSQKRLLRSDSENDDVLQLDTIVIDGLEND